MKILVSPTSVKKDSTSPSLQKLKKFADEIVYNETGRPLGEAELIALLQDCDGYLAGLDFITDKVLRSCPKLKAISRYGAGYDRVDIKAAKELNIKVTNTPGANAEAVGELAFGMVLALARNLVPLDKKTKENEWVRACGIELFGKTMGIVGLGAIGRVMVRCAKGMGMSVIAYDPYINMEYCMQQNIKSVGFEELLRTADVISLHLPLNEQTKYIIDEEKIWLMKPGVLLINASRGGLIQETAVEKALEEGRIGGLGLDAFEQEPPVGSRLLQHENVIATPHTGAHTKEAAEQMLHMSVDNLIMMLSGEECPYEVNSIL